jgi:hypothetical protein
VFLRLLEPSTSIPSIARLGGNQLSKLMPEGVTRAIVPLSREITGATTAPIPEDVEKEVDSRVDLLALR